MVDEQSDSVKDPGEPGESLWVAVLQGTGADGNVSQVLGRSSLLPCHARGRIHHRRLNCLAAHPRHAPSVHSVLST